MHKDSLDFAYNAEGDYYDLVVDKKIQRVVEELKALHHDVLIRHLTYWSGGSEPTLTKFLRLVTKSRQIAIRTSPESYISKNLQESSTIQNISVNLLSVITVIIVRNFFVL